MTFWQCRWKDIVTVINLTAFIAHLTYNLIGGGNFGKNQILGKPCSFVIH